MATYVTSRLLDYINLSTLRVLHHCKYRRRSMPKALVPCLVLGGLTCLILFVCAADASGSRENSSRARSSRGKGQIAMRERFISCLAAHKWHVSWSFVGRNVASLYIAALLLGTVQGFRSWSNVSPKNCAVGVIYVRTPIDNLLANSRGYRETRIATSRSLWWFSAPLQSYLRSNGI